jgi:hypothetical protein
MATHDSRRSRSKRSRSKRSRSKRPRTRRPRTRRPRTRRPRQGKPRRVRTRRKTRMNGGMQAVAGWMERRREAKEETRRVAAAEETRQLQLRLARRRRQAVNLPQDATEPQVIAAENAAEKTKKDRAVLWEKKRDKQKEDAELAQELALANTRRVAADAVLIHPMDANFNEEEFAQVMAAQADLTGKKSRDQATLQEQQRQERQVAVDKGNSSIHRATPLAGYTPDEYSL